MIARVQLGRSETSSASLKRFTVQINVIYCVWLGVGGGGGGSGRGLHNDVQPAPSLPPNVTVNVGTMDQGHKVQGRVRWIPN